eukprot:scaffold17318_cov23-Tisochrysis_lutea.AAC.2
MCKGQQRAHDACIQRPRLATGAVLVVGWRMQYAQRIKLLLPIDAPQRLWPCMRGGGWIDKDVVTLHDPGTSLPFPIHASQ